MSILRPKLEIIKAPNEILHQKSQPIHTVTDEIRTLFIEMYQYLTNTRNGIGLAAVQVGYLVKLIILHHENFFSEPIAQNLEYSQIMELEEKYPIVMLNPRIIQSSDHYTEFEEGCLSFPKLFVKVKRPADVTIEYEDIKMHTKVLKLSHSILSVCVQHEIDHTNGKVFLDRISPLKRSLALQKYKKLSTSTED
ncbi:peptide deformylase [Candidatus Fokinia crypta]|uniref:Peptide deformylase n=1 Tax=Candidatus Fokinia crypta TaxID=1920990 RepID=A0ABZ0URC2_9RICK|nr:peptide deformylase [Candidatus Fokinia cryptica]WPX97801.1 Peptide deformylase [Candidatus Fokinia cryptica]